MAVKKNLIIVTELLKQFKDMDDSFLKPIRSHDDKVNNDTINFNEIGADPAVLIDNVTYPIATNSRTDDSKVVSLHKLETENTKITDDELYALPYDKKSSVREQHLNALMVAHIKLGAHSLAPQADGANTPVIKTTGTLSGGRRAMLPADLVTLKDKADFLEIPIESRHLVLSAKHVNDLLLVDQAFRDRYYNTPTGKMIPGLYGFNIWESLHTPKYVAAFTKKVFGAAPLGTDLFASVFFSTVNAMKAKGSAKIYQRNAEEDPENRQTVIGLRMYDIVAPVSTVGTGAIIDNNV
ncbi:MAG: hypothetical protein JNK73_13180 [Bacteroidia bacterium]|nr:hypothetical protein [Bacteroidia bacterium]